MLAKVGHPRVVCPDPRLYLAARRRGWPILAW
jgi:phosphoserine phosphatase